MNKYSLALFSVFLKFAFVRLFGFSWLFFDPLLALVVLYAFFHHLEARDYFLYALFCGFLREFFSLDVFGIYALSYPASAFLVASLSSFVYKEENGRFVLVMVFVAALLNNFVILVLRALLSASASFSGWGWLALKMFLESLGTVLAAWPLYHLSKRCGLEFVG